MEVKNLTPILATMGYMEKGMTRVFKDSLKKEMDDMRDLAKIKLEEASIARTGKKYWTGTLQETISSVITKDEPGRIEGLVGVDVGKYPRVKDYAVPVETGHKMGVGKLFWEGYHYMEKTLVELAPGMANRIGKTLNAVIEAKTSYGTGWRNVASGRYSVALK